MKKHLFLLLLLINAVAYAQQRVTTWSEKLKGAVNDRFEFVGAYSDKYYLIRKIEGKNYLLVFDSLLKKTNEQLLKTGTVKNTEIAATGISGDNIIVFFKDRDYTKETVHASSINSKTLQPVKEFELIAEIPRKKHDSLNYILNCNPSAINFYYWGNQLDEHVIRFGYYLFDGNLVKTKEREIKGEADNYIPVECTVWGKHVTLLTRIRPIGTPIEYNSVSFSYRFYSAAFDDSMLKFTESDFHTLKGQNPYFILDTDDLLHSFRFVYHPENKLFIDCIYEAVSAVDGKVISKSTASVPYIPVAHVDSNHLKFPPLTIMNVKNDESGFTIHAENVMHQKFFNPVPENTQTENIAYDDLLPDVVYVNCRDGFIYSFDKDFHFIGVNTIPKKQELSRKFHSSTMFSWLYEPSLLIYNDDARNVDLKDESKRVAYYEGSKTVMKAINFSGENKTVSTINPEKKPGSEYLIPSFTKKIGKNKLLLLTREWDQYRIGILQLKD